MLRRLLIIVTVLGTAAITMAQPLADRVPADALIYVGWQGSAAMPRAYAGSHLKAVLDESNLGSLYSDYLSRAFQQLGGRDPRSAQMVRTLMNAGGILWRHPTAIYFAGIDITPAGARPKVAVLCQAGAEADTLLAQYRRLAELNRGAALPLRGFKSGDLVVLARGYDHNDQIVAGSTAPAPKALAGNSKFSQAMGQVQADAVVAVYVDAQGVLALADQIAVSGGKLEDAAAWIKMRDALGLKGIHRLALSGGFDGRDWSTQLFIAAPSPRQGLAALLDAKPIATEVLKLIPQNTAFAGVEQADPGAIFDLLQAAAGGMDAKTRSAFSQQVAQINRTSGFDLRKDLLASLDRHWIYYSQPLNGAADPMGFVVVNHLAKPVDAERMINQLGKLAKDVLVPTPKGTSLALKTQVINQTAVQSLINSRWGSIMPSWTVSGGNLILALVPRNVFVAANTVGTGKSILENADFVALRQRLGGRNLVSFSYADLNKTMAWVYPQLQAGANTLFTLGKLLGIEPPPRTLPSPELLSRHLGLMAAFTWVDDAGWHYRGISPFPGSALLAPNGGWLTVGGGLAGLAALIGDFSANNPPPVR